MPEKGNLTEGEDQNGVNHYFDKQRVGDREFIWTGNSDKTIKPTVAEKVTKMEFQSEIVVSGERQLVPFAQQCSCSFSRNNKEFSRELLDGGNQPYKELPERIYIFFVALRSSAVHGLLILEVSRSHTATCHSR
jgi:hypothetical protein